MSNKIFEVLSIDEMNKIESPGWLIQEAVPAKGLIQIFGREGHGKTFVAIDMALRIASGLPWAGNRTTKPGKVIYVAGEGIPGVKKRVRAWMRHNNIDSGRLTGFRVVPEPVQLGETPHVSGIVESIEKVTGDRHCDLIVFDTQARCTAGIDENSAEEMGVVVAALDWLRLETGAAIILIHHSPYNVERGRGSSVVPGALDTVIGVNKKEHIITLSCKKQKDWEEFGEFKIGLVPHDESAVVIELGFTEEAAKVAQGSLGDLELSLMSAMGQIGTSSLHDAMKAWGKPKSTFYRTLGKLKQLKLLEETKRGQFKLFVPTASHASGA